MSPPKEYLQKYVWHDRGQSFGHAWQIILTDGEALAFIAFVTALLAYAQMQAWKLARLAVKRATRPIQLPDEDEPGSLGHLGQRDAILYLLAIWQPRRRKVGRGEMKSVSPWFGIIALANIAVFLALGALVPWLLTAGLETPLVQSRTWDGCLRNDGSNDLSGKGEKEANLAAIKYESCWFNRSGTRDSCRQGESIPLDRPIVHVSRNVICPFTGSACHPDVKPLQLDHINLTFRDYGLNFDSRLLYSHRLTCAPLNLEHFTTVDSNGTSWLLFTRVDPSFVGSDGVYAPLDQPLSWFDEYGNGMVMEAGDHPVLRQQLSSSDGRRSRPVDSDVFSWVRDSPPDVTIWGGYSGSCEPNSLYNFHYLHPDLDQRNGKIFVITFSAGRLRYLQPIEDPIYSAHFNPDRRGF